MNTPKVLIIADPFSLAKIKNLRLQVSLGFTAFTALLVGGLISIGGLGSSWSEFWHDALLGPFGYAVLSMSLVVFLITFFEYSLLVRMLTPFKLTRLILTSAFCAVQCIIWGVLAMTLGVFLLLPPHGLDNTGMHDFVGLLMVSFCVGLVEFIIPTTLVIMAVIATVYWLLCRRYSKHHCNH